MLMAAAGTDRHATECAHPWSLRSEGHAGVNLHAAYCTKAARLSCVWPILRPCVVLLAEYFTVLMHLSPCSADRSTEVVTMTRCQDRLHSTKLGLNLSLRQWHDVPTVGRSPEASPPHYELLALCYRNPGCACHYHIPACFNRVSADGMIRLSVDYITASAIWCISS